MCSEGTWGSTGKRRCSMARSTDHTSSSRQLHGHSPGMATPLCRGAAGVGLDFNTELVEGISKVRGANYFSVHSPGEFRRRLTDEFDYAVRCGGRQAGVSSQCRAALPSRGR